MERGKLHKPVPCCVSNTAEANQNIDATNHPTHTSQYLRRQNSKQNEEYKEHERRDVLKANQRKLFSSLLSFAFPRCPQPCPIDQKRTSTSHSPAPPIHTAASFGFCYLGRFFFWFLPSEWKPLGAVKKKRRSNKKKTKIQAEMCSNICMLRTFV
jgi:hypothetical protein